MEQDPLKDPSPLDTPGNSAHAAPLPAGGMASPGMADPLLSEAGRVFDQLRVRLNELEHREKQIAEKSQELDDRQARFFKMVQQTEVDLKDREDQVTAREQQVVTRSDELDERIRSCDARQQSLEFERVEWDRIRTKQEAELQEAEAEVEYLRTTRFEEISRREREAEELITRKRDQFEEFCQQELAQISQQQAQATRKLQLQEDHLERLQHQVEQKKRDFEIDQQRTTQRLQARTENERRLRNQLLRHRERLDQFAKSIERAQRLVQADSADEQSMLDQQRQDLQRQWDEWQVIRQQWLHRQEEEQAHLSRQQEFMLRQQERIQVVRTEVEDQYRETLAMRFQLEALRAEAATELGQSFQEDRLDDLRGQIEQSDTDREAQAEAYRTSLSQEYDQIRQWLAEAKKQDESLRRGMTEGMIKWEHQRMLAEQARERLLEAQQSWEQRRKTILTERHEAEAVIRDLISQLDQYEQPSGLKAA